MNLASSVYFSPKNHMRHFLRKFSDFLPNFQPLPLFKTIGNPVLEWGKSTISDQALFFDTLLFQNFSFLTLVFSILYSFDNFSFVIMVFSRSQFSNFYFFEILFFDVIAFDIFFSRLFFRSLVIIPFFANQLTIQMILCLAFWKHCSEVSFRRNLT